MRAGRLGEVFAILKNAANANPKALDLPPPKMAKIAKSLDHDRAVKPLAPRPDALPKWKLAMQTKDFSKLTLADIRSLFWEKEVALTESFLEYVFSRKLSVRRSSLKGVSYVLASRWNEVLEGVIPLEQHHHTVSQISKSDFLNRIAPYIFDAAGHSRFAEQVVSRRSKLSDLFTEVFGIVMPGCQYTAEVLSVVSESAFTVALSSDRKDREWFYNSILSELSKVSLISCLGKIVSHIEQANAEEAKEELKGFILSHPNLGDPRLPGFESNWDKNSPTTQAIIEWLSQSDINFFFELFFQEKADVQGRKKFWLPYAHLIRGTRVVISESDKQRLFKQLTEMDGKQVNKRIFGDLADKNVRATAFIMDFGSVKVVEFSLPNHACYFYERESSSKLNDRSYFWDNQRFRESELKDKRHSSAKVSHHEGWESKFSNLLATYGIRPKARSRRVYNG